MKQAQSPSLLAGPTVLISSLLSAGQEHQPSALIQGFLWTRATVFPVTGSDKHKAQWAGGQGGSFVQQVPPQPRGHSVNPGPP